MKPIGLFSSLRLFSLGALFALFQGQAALLRAKPARFYIQEDSQKAKARSHTTKPPSSSGSPLGLLELLAESVAGYFGCPDLTNHPYNKDIDKDVIGCNPAEARGHVQVSHRHSFRTRFSYPLWLALLCDRPIQSLQQAVQRQGDYGLRTARSFPGICFAPKTGTGLPSAIREPGKKARERSAGALIFRSNAAGPPATRSVEPAAALFVFFGC